MKHTLYRLLTLSLAAWLVCGLLVATVPAAQAAEDTVYLGDRQDLFLGRDSLDEFGWNTAHSGESIRIGTRKFNKGLGFHCLPDKDAYCEFDISGLGMKYFAASVGVQKEASYFLEWGSISFHVYGDGKLLASSPMVVWNEEPYFLSCSVEGVKTLRLVEKNENGHACDAGVWGDARLTMTKPVGENPGEGGTAMDPNKTDLPQPAELVSGDYAYLSDLYWMNSKTYTGNVVGRDCNTANEIIISNDDKFFRKGVGFHAVSGNYDAYIDVNVEGLGFTKLAAYVGVSESLSPHDISMAAVKFAVFGDGVKLWESGTLRFAQPMEAMECDITGVKILRLAVAGAPGISGAWATYGGAVISKSGNVTDEMLFEDYSFEPLPEDTTEAPTEPTTEAPTEPATEAPTDPVTEAPSAEGTVPATEAPTKVPAPDGTAAPVETDPPKGGCGAALACGALTATAAAAVVLKKRKED